MNTETSSKTKATVWVLQKGQIRPGLDQLTTEEPLEIRLVPLQNTIAVIIRTPGADFELATGSIYSEGVKWMVSSATTS